MINQYYHEVHVMPDPLLPFIFHRDLVSHSSTFIPQWHENLELLHCISGSGSIYSGTAQQPFEPGDIRMINSNVIHSVCSPKSVEYHCLIIDNSFWQSNGIPVSSLQFEPLIRDERALDCFRDIADAFACCDTQPLWGKAAVRNSALELMLLLCREHLNQDPSAIPEPLDPRIQESIFFIQQHLSEPLTLERIAEHVCISPFHLSRKFRQYTGSTVNQMINLLRCTRARQLIEGGETVGLAAMSCGFQNMSYFTRTFKRYFQMLPSACRDTEAVP